ncbi:MAG: FAD-dependent oxidoreductase [Rhodobacteraceae bacterium]|nr:FAD-dependent oxidoreductase [Paracoccaceae bacterium]
MSGIVVIGAGQAGASLVARLRAEGHGGEITLIGAEPVPPYQRPPLSKGYLLGELPVERLFLRPTSFYDEHGIVLKLGTEAVAVDRAARQVALADGERLAYDQLVLTTGSRPRRLPEAVGGGLDGVFTVRTLADVDAMAPTMTAGARALIVGGGYIGLEAAAVARKLGLQVTLVEMAERILARVACAETAAWFRALHRSKGVDLREGVGLERLEGGPGVTGAVLSDGSRIAADLVIVGIGVAPDTRLATAAGLAVENGIAVDAMGRTSEPAVWAAGDCTSFPWQGGRIRLESVQNAIDQAECVARNLAGAAEPYRPQPWFWSDQYDVKLQIAGLNAGYDRVAVRPGARDGTVSHWYYRGGVLVSVDAMNDPRAYMAGKRLIEAGLSPAPSVIGDPAQDLRTLLAAG